MCFIVGKALSNIRIRVRTVLIWRGYIQHQITHNESKMAPNDSVPVDLLDYEIIWIYRRGSSVLLSKETHSSEPNECRCTQNCIEVQKEMIKIFKIMHCCSTIANKNEKLLYLTTFCLTKKSNKLFFPRIYYHVFILLFTDCILINE